MWLYLIGVLLIIIGIGGGVVGGGVFSFIAVPLGIIALVTAYISSRAAKRAAEGSGQNAEAKPSAGRPLPHSMPSDPAHTATSPEALTDQRRVQQ